MSAQRWAAFAGVWVALVVFSVDAVRHARSRQTPVVVADL